MSATARETAAVVSRADPLEYDLDVVRDVLGESLGERLVAIVLGGGFGRGEGCFREEDGRLVPVNDLDLYLVLREPAPRETLAELESRIARDTLVGAVDLLPRLEGDLGALPPTIENVDLACGSRVVWGDAGVLERMSTIDPTSLPLWEAENLLRNRLVTLLEGHPSGAGPAPAVYQRAKAVLAVVDAMLVRDGRYVTRYAEKVERYLEAPALGDEDRPLVEDALRVKRELPPPGGDASPAWEPTVDFYLRGLVDFFRVYAVDDWCRRRDLLGRFHFSTTSPWRTVKKLVRIAIGSNALFDLDRLLLALCIDAPRIDTPSDGEEPLAPEATLARLARTCGIAPGEPHELRERAIARWYGLRK